MSPDNKKDLVLSNSDLAYREKQMANFAGKLMIPRFGHFFETLDKVSQAGGLVLIIDPKLISRADVAKIANELIIYGGFELGPALALSTAVNSRNPKVNKYFGIPQNGLYPFTAVTDIIDPITHAVSRVLLDIFGENSPLINGYLADISSTKEPVREILKVAFPNDDMEEIAKLVKLINETQTARILDERHKLLVVPDKNADITKLARQRLKIHGEEILDKRIGANKIQELFINILLAVGQEAHQKLLNLAEIDLVLKNSLIVNSDNDPSGITTIGFEIAQWLLQGISVQEIKEYLNSRNNWKQPFFQWFSYYLLMMNLFRINKATGVNHSTSHTAAWQMNNFDLWKPGGVLESEIDFSQVIQMKGLVRHIHEIIQDRYPNWLGPERIDN